MGTPCALIGKSGEMWINTQVKWGRVEYNHM
jgi:hypothetical protein